MGTSDLAHGSAPGTLDLAGRLAQLPDRRTTSPWDGYEHARGWGVFGLPTSEGHYLGLRVMPENDFAPYRTVWHRDPAGAWSIFVDAPRLDIACPRYYGAACERTEHAAIDVEWTGPSAFHVHVDRPELDWTVQVDEPAAFRLMNSLSRPLPLWTWRPASLVRAREILADRVLGLGAIRLAATMPSGHFGVLMPVETYLITGGHAVLDGVDLGTPDHTHPNPMIGDVPLPSRGVVGVGLGHWRILDRAEYDRTRTEVATPPADGPRGAEASVSGGS